MRSLSSVLVAFAIFLLKLVLVEAHPIDTDSSDKPKRGRHHRDRRPPLPFDPQLRFFITDWQHMLILAAFYVVFETVRWLKERRSSNGTPAPDNGANGLNPPSSESESSALNSSSSSISSYSTFSLPIALQNPALATPPDAPGPRSNWDDDLAAIRCMLGRGPPPYIPSSAETADNQNDTHTQSPGSEGIGQSAPANDRHSSPETQSLDVPISASLNGSGNIGSIIPESPKNGYVIGSGKAAPMTDAGAPSTSEFDLTITPGNISSGVAYSSGGQNGTKPTTAYNSASDSGIKGILNTTQGKGDKQRRVRFWDHAAQYQTGRAVRPDSSVPRPNTTCGDSFDSTATNAKTPVQDKLAQTFSGVSPSCSSSGHYPANGKSNGLIPPGEIMSSRPAPPVPDPVPRPRSGMQHRRTPCVSSQDDITGSHATATGSRPTPHFYDFAQAAEEEEKAVQFLAQSTIDVDPSPIASRPSCSESIREPWSDLSVLPDLPAHDNRREEFKERTLRTGKM